MGLWTSAHSNSPKRTSSHSHSLAPRAKAAYSAFNFQAAATYPIGNIMSDNVICLMVKTEEAPPSEVITTSFYADDPPEEEKPKPWLAYSSSRQAHPRAIPMPAYGPPSPRRSLRLRCICKPYSKLFAVYGSPYVKNACFHSPSCTHVQMRRYAPEYFRVTMTSKEFLNALRSGRFGRRRWLQPRNGPRSDQRWRTRSQ